MLQLIFIKPSGRISPELTLQNKHAVACTRVIHCLFAFGAGIWNLSWGNEAWYWCPWRNIRFKLELVLLRAYSRLRECNHAALCYSCMSLKNYREISYGWIFCFLSCETRFSTRFSIACSGFSILDSRRNREWRIESRIATRNGLSTFFWTLL